MAPTEILAQQHFTGIRGLLEAMHIPVAVLTGTVKGKERKDTLHALAHGALPIVIAHTRSLRRP
jgi:ATP-dependent DNA helicase RecG